jgi:very-short-patch-repair endonuclease
LKDVKSYDEYREKLITEFGLHVLRFTNEEIFKDLDSVLKKIIDFKNLSKKEEQ